MGQAVELVLIYLTKRTHKTESAFGIHQILLILNVYHPFFPMTSDHTKMEHSEYGFYILRIIRKKNPISHDDFLLLVDTIHKNLKRKLKTLRFYK